MEALVLERKGELSLRDTFDRDPAKASVTSDDVGAWTQTEWNTFVYTS